MGKPSSAADVVVGSPDGSQDASCLVILEPAGYGYSSGESSTIDPRPAMLRVSALPPPLTTTVSPTANPACDTTSSAVAPAAAGTTTTVCTSVTTVAVGMVTSVIVGAAVITGSSLQSAADIAILVW